MKHLTILRKGRIFHPPSMVDQQELNQFKRNNSRKKYRKRSTTPRPAMTTEMKTKTTDRLITTKMVKGFKMDKVNTTLRTEFRMKATARRRTTAKNNENGITNLT